MAKLGNAGKNTSVNMHLVLTCIYLVSFVRKKIVGAEVCLVNSELDCSENAIKDASHTLNDRDMLTEFGTIDFHSKVVKCHEICRTGYMNKTVKIQK